MAVSEGMEVARTGATVEEKVECVQRLFDWATGSPNIYLHIQCHFYKLLIYIGFTTKFNTGKQYFSRIPNPSSPVRLWVAPPVKSLIDAALFAMKIVVDVRRFSCRRPALPDLSADD